MLLVVGIVGRTVGVRGEVAVDLRTDDPEGRFAEGSAISVFRGADPVPGRALQILVVRSSRWHSGRFVVSFREIADRDAAAALTGSTLAAEVDILDGDDPEEFHDQALVGLQARLPSGAQVGLVDSVIHLPGQDLLSVVDGSGGELLVPFVARIVPEVNVAGGYVVIDPPEGLAELVAG